MKLKADARDTLLKAAKEEFLEVGFENASIRNICKKAGVNSGTLYFFFKDKDDLFMELVINVIKGLEKIIKVHNESQGKKFSDINMSYENLIGENNREIEIFIKYMYKYKDEFKLILEKSTGSKYENGLKHFVRVQEESIKNRLQDIEELKDIDKYSIHWLAHMEVYSLVELFINNLSLEEALKQSKVIVKYLSAGWMGLLNKI